VRSPEESASSRHSDGAESSQSAVAMSGGREGGQRNRAGVQVCSDRWTRSCLSSWEGEGEGALLELRGDPGQAGLWGQLFSLLFSAFVASNDFDGGFKTAPGSRSRVRGVLLFIDNRGLAWSHGGGRKGELG
jgi:hypothetical protein